MSQLKVTLICIIAILLLSACKSKALDTNTIKFTSREAVNKEEKHIIEDDFLSSELLEVSYTGSQRFTLSFELWIDGNLDKVIMTTQDIVLSNINSIILSVNSSKEDKFEVAVEYQYKNGSDSTMANYLSSEIVGELNYRTESVISDREIFVSDEEEIALWAFHTHDFFSEENTEEHLSVDYSEGIRSVAEQFDLSVVVMLRPSEEESTNDGI